MWHKPIKNLSMKRNQIRKLNSYKARWTLSWKSRMRWNQSWRRRMKKMSNFHLNLHSKLTLRRMRVRCVKKNNLRPKPNFRLKLTRWASRWKKKQRRMHHWITNSRLLEIRWPNSSLKQTMYKRKSLRQKSKRVKVSLLSLSQKHLRSQSLQVLRRSRSIQKLRAS